MRHLLIYSLSERWGEMNQRNHRKLTGRKVIPLQETQTVSQNTTQREKVSETSTTFFRQPRKIVFALVGIVAILMTGYPMIQTLTHSKEVAHDYAVSQEAHEQAIQQNRSVQQEYQKVQNPDYLAEIARRDYFYSKPGEIIFDLGDGTEQAEADLFQNAPSQEELDEELKNE